MDSSNLFLLLAKRVPRLFSKESVNELVSQNKISFEHAKESLASIDLTDLTKKAETNTNTTSTMEKMDKLGFYAQVKFEAMLESAKEDDRMLYDDFVEIDNQRNKIIAEIASKREGDVNSLLNALKTLPNVESNEIDEMISLSIKVEDIR